MTLAPSPPHRPQKTSGGTLRGRYVDLLTDGVSADALKQRGDRAVDHALMSTALSAVCAGMGEQDWLALVVDPRRKLGQQARFVKGRPRSQNEYYQYLTRVWSRALDQGHAVALRDRSRYRDEARLLVRRWDAFLTREIVAELNPDEALLLMAFLDKISDVESPRVAFGRRALQETTGVPERRLRTRMANLQRRGVVRLEVRGRPGGPHAKKRLANVYSLSGPELLADQLREIT
ncbi:hypothetical protein GCM10009641_61890 [Mycobacterium cookii]|uniref:Uncharacterized protein n=1 Tax=Nocardioides furvisabuli TaxID=375542 RepID=A0ABP5IYZ9_9ACTN